MKRTLLLVAATALAIAAHALQPQRGYRGFVNWDNNLTQYHVWFQSNTKTYFYSGVSTSHGFQFNPNFYLGGGLAVQYNDFSESFIVPVFVDVRTDQKFGKFTPFADLRLGYSLTDGGGVYAAPMVGYRFNWGRKLGINVAVGLTVKRNTYDIIDYSTANEGYVIWQKVGTTHDTKLMFAFSVGFDF